MRVRCRADGERLVVEVPDEGVGIAARDDSPGRWAKASRWSVRWRGRWRSGTRADGPGTIVTMSFAAAPHRAGDPALEPLCGLALERVADVSCVDVVSGGVLRRAAAEVAGDPELTAWLRGALPPAKPGTATWRALREAAPIWSSMTPASPARPGGTGERLGLTWWVSIPLEGPRGCRRRSGASVGARAAAPFRRRR